MDSLAIGPVIARPLTHRRLVIMAVLAEAMGSVPQARLSIWRPPKFPFRTTRRITLKVIPAGVLVSGLVPTDQPSAPTMGCFWARIMRPDTTQNGSLIMGTQY